MPTLMMAPDLKPLVDGQATIQVEALGYKALLEELTQRFPKLTAAKLDKYNIAVNGAIVQNPLLQRFPENAQLVLVAKIAGG